MRKIIPYKKYLLAIAKELRQNMTLAEILLWQEMKNNPLQVRFSRQIPIDDFIVDFYCKDLQLAIELDGESHHHDEQIRKDKLRQERLEYLGVHFIRFDDLDVKTDIHWVMNMIYDKVEELKTQP